MKIIWPYHSLQLLIKVAAKCQAMKPLGQSNPIQTLVKEFTKCEVRKGTGPIHTQTLVEATPQSQALQSLWEVDSFQTLIELPTQCEALQLAGPSDILQGLIEMPPKGHPSEMGPSEVEQTLVEAIAEGEAL